MAKNFPYFKFIATEWLTGDIVYEDLSIQGLFINVCALYWQRDGNLTIDDIRKRYKHDNLIDHLIDRYIYLNDKNIIIRFLDEQLLEANHISKVNSENGKKGATAKRIKATAKRPLSDRQANLSKEKENKRKEKKEDINIPSFDEVFNYCKVDRNRPNIDVNKLRAKYDSYLEGGWVDGYGNKIVNWKSKFIQLITYIDDTKQSTNTAINGMVY